MAVYPTVDEGRRESERVREREREREKEVFTTFSRYKKGNIESVQKAI